MDHWDELRTALAVARLGTVSAAAAQLGLHRATVVRHVEVLEEALGGRLFQRHARGYTPTDAGADLLRVAGAADAQFRELGKRTRGRRSEVAGEVIVTSVDVVAPLVLRALCGFTAAHPGATLRFETSNRVFALEYGEAHVGVRTGAVTDDPDNVVQPWLVLRSALYARRAYVEAHGRPEAAGDLAGHALIGDDTRRHLPSRWLDALVPEATFSFTSRDPRQHRRAIVAGMGIGFMPVQVAEAEADLVQVLPPRAAWDLPFWLVTHVDLHWTAKVQAVLAALKTVGTPF